MSYPRRLIHPTQVPEDKLPLGSVWTLDGCLSHSPEGPSWLLWPLLGPHVPVSSAVRVKRCTRHIRRSWCLCQDVRSPTPRPGARPLWPTRQAGSTLCGPN